MSSSKQYSGHLPFQEKKSRLRGILDLASGCYPSFLFGCGVGRKLPVFHFHDASADYLEPYFEYLSENGYETVNSDAIGRLVREGADPGPKRVVLCFDDAWTSLWTVVAPLLRKYELTAVAYPVAGRVKDAASVRKTMDDLDASSLAEQAAVEELCTWPELKALSESGLVDMQAHTYSHAKMFCDNEVYGFVTPETKMTMMSWPLLSPGESPGFLNGSFLGAPLYPTRSRMTDGFRYLHDEKVQQRCMDHVRENGGEEFFRKNEWSKELTDIAWTANGKFERQENREQGIRDELVLSKEVLEGKLGKKITQICMPWGIGGMLAERFAEDAGYDTMIADELWGKRFVTPGGNPYRIMRLKHQYIRCLPGKDRKFFFSC